MTNELRAYLLSRVVWKPDLDWREERREFCTTYDGEKAGRIIEKYLDDVRATFLKQGIHGGTNRATTSPFHGSQHHQGSATTAESPGCLSKKCPAAHRQRGHGRGGRSLCAGPKRGMEMVTQVDAGHQKGTDESFEWRSCHGREDSSFCTCERAPAGDWGTKSDLVRAVTKRGAARIRTGDGGFAIRCLSHLATAPKTEFIEV